jgi:hypothetical protein
MAIDFESDLGRVRLLIADFDESQPIFTDEHLTGYLSLKAGSVKRAAADALDAIATSEVLLGKKIRTQDVTTDGPAVAADLRKKARELRDEADAEDGAFFDVTPLEVYCRPEGSEYRL